MGSMLTLNLGCGSDTWGDCRVDSCYNFLDNKNKPTLLADAQHLPFKDASFRSIKSNHLLEHLSNPFEALKEMNRVATEELKLAFPVETDVWPFILSRILPFPHLKECYLACETRRKKLHIWIINPKIVLRYLEASGWIGTLSKGYICIFTEIESGRKSKIFKPLSLKARIPMEYVIEAKKKHFTQSRLSLKK
jgi:hypothetical protein